MRLAEAKRRVGSAVRVCRACVASWLLLAKTSQNEDLAKLRPHLEEALETMERLERRRGLSDREKMRAGALRMLLTSIEQVK